MDVSPTEGKAKGAKSAAKVASAKPPRKTLTTRKKPAEPAPVVLEMTAEAPLDLSSMIATAAFYLAAERQFQPGCELDDWLEAERRIRAQYPT